VLYVLHFEICSFFYVTLISHFIYEIDYVAYFQTNRCPFTDIFKVWYVSRLPTSHPPIPFIAFRRTPALCSAENGTLGTTVPCREAIMQEYIKLLSGLLVILLVWSIKRRFNTDLQHGGHSTNQRSWVYQNPPRNSTGDWLILMGQMWRTTEPDLGLSLS